jgi:hypothetical protein
VAADSRSLQARLFAVTLRLAPFKRIESEPGLIGAAAIHR